MREDKPIQWKIASVMGSSVVQDRLYATTEGDRFFVGGGNPFRWRKVSAAAPANLISARPSRGRDVLYAESRAIYRSAYGGRNWQRRSCDLVLGGPDSAAIASREPNVIYLAADAGDGPVGNGQGGFYRTRDGGRTWTRSTTFPTANSHDEVLLAVAVDPTDPDDVTIGPNAGGVARSLDGGNDWTFESMGLKPIDSEGA